MSLLRVARFFTMTLEGALANINDLLRLHELEHKGFFPAGFATKATSNIFHYTMRIIYLHFKFRAMPYPGPKVTIE